MASWAVQRGALLFVGKRSGDRGLRIRAVANPD